MTSPPSSPPAGRGWLWLALAGVASCLACGVGGALLLGAAALVGEESGAPAVEGGTPGAFALATPAGWERPSETRLVRTHADGGATLGLTATLLGPVDPQGDPDAALRALWEQHVRPHFPAAARPAALRRCVGDGARAWFATQRLRQTGRDVDALVGIYLIEAAPWQALATVQEYDQPGNVTRTIVDQMAGYSWDRSHAFVEELLAQVRTGLAAPRPLVAPEELTGRFVFDSANAMEWVNPLTGGSLGVSTVAYSVEYELTGDGGYRYRFQGASGQLGDLRVSTDADEGRWRIEGDQLVLESARGQVQRRRIAGARRAADGKRQLLLMRGPGDPFLPSALGSTLEAFEER